MPTTTLRLPDALKLRVAAVVSKTPKITPHLFMLQAIAEKTALEEQRQDFSSQADERYDRMVTSGKAIAWADMRAYLLARVTGTSEVAKPKARKIDR
jgi:predicted transcriptional regulator